MQQTTNRNYQKLYAPYGFSPDFAIMYEYYPIPEDSIRFLHRHNTLEIGYCIKGAGNLVVETKSMPFQKGSVCVITNSEFHTATNKKGIKGEWSVWYFIETDPEKLL